MVIDQVKSLSPFGRFCYWIQERQWIRNTRNRGYPPPWTHDIILQSYRFCNVRRMDDKVSRWLLENWYEPYKDHPRMLEAVALARFINLPRSLEAITGQVFDNQKYQINWAQIKRILRSLRESGPIFNGAYMVRGNDGIDKVECVIEYYVRPLSKIEIDPSSMESTWTMILPSYGMGSFMAGQIVADLRWAITGEWNDKHTWAPKGPGSQRGLNRLKNLPLKNQWDQDEFVEELQDVIAEVKLEVPRAIWANLEAHDYQNCLCEFDKYERVLWGEGRPKARYEGTGNNEL